MNAKIRIVFGPEWQELKGLHIDAIAAHPELFARHFGETPDVADMYTFVGPLKCPSGPGALSLHMDIAPTPKMEQFLREANAPNMEQFLREANGN
jgi:hypothetical protein